MNDCRNQVYRLMLAVNRCTGVYVKIAKELGIKENTLLLIDILSDGNPHSQKQICEDWMIPRTTLNTIIGECIKEGYLLLLPQPHSKEKRISLTDKGRLFAEQSTKAMNLAVETALQKTCKDYSIDFISAFETYVNYLQQECSNI